jgi:hypothetical protein
MQQAGGTLSSQIEGYAECKGTITILISYNFNVLILNIRAQKLSPFLIKVDMPLPLEHTIYMYSLIRANLSPALETEAGARLVRRTIIY